MRHSSSAPPAPGGAYTPSFDRPPGPAPAPDAIRVRPGARPLARAVALVVALAATIAVALASAHFVQTFDEPAHLAAGMEWIAHGRYDYDPQHPPLARIAVAGGPYLAGARPHDRRTSWEEGNAILTAGGHYRRTLALARAGILPFFLLLLGVVWAWARWLSGERAAALAVLLAATSSQLLAHAGLATTDLPLAATLVWALYAFARFLERPTVARGAHFGIAGAAAIGSKLSSLPFFALAALLIVLARWLLGDGRAPRAATAPDESPRPRAMRIDARALRPYIAPAAVATATAGLLVWALYRFHVAVAHGVVPVPAPELAAGIRVLAAHNHEGHSAFLLGAVRERGWWYYSLVAIGVKSPLSLLSLGALAVALAVRGARRGDGWRPLAPLLGVAAVVLVAMAANIDIGVRHLLPVYPLLAIAGASAAAWVWRASPARTLARAAIGALVAAQVVGAVRAYPDFLADFNALAGHEPSRVLVDSNLDWGQDLGRLADTLAARRIGEVTLYYFGSAPVGAVRLADTVRIGGGPATGWVAASRTYLAGAYIGCVGWLARERPVARIGSSILLYHILPDTAPRVPEGARAVTSDAEPYGATLGTPSLQSILCHAPRILIRGVGTAPSEAGDAHPSLLGRARAALGGLLPGHDGGKTAGDPAPDSPAGVTDRMLLAAGDSTADWLTYGHDYANRRWSPLAQIDAGNVHRLTLAWVHQLEGPPGGQETTPVEAGGVLYYTGPFGDVVAVNARTGEELWRHQWKLASVPTCCGAKNRGVAVYGSRVYVGTLDDHLLALDARTGRVAWDVEVAEPDIGYSITMAPLAVDGKIIVGVAGSEFGIRGFVDAYDAATGARIWRFNTVPSPDEGGWWGKWSRATPDGDPLPRDIARERRDSARYADAWKVGGGGVWNTPSYDPELGLIYFGVGNPAPNMDGSVRPGDNLYTSSIVALELRTGKLRWYYQEVPHDLWDYDATSPTVLVDATVDGKRVPAVAQAGKVGWVYILDRRTGARIRRSAPFVPHENTFAAPTTDGVRIMPGMGGGSNFAPASYSPRTGLVYVSGIVEPILFVLSPERNEPGVKWQGGRHVPLAAAQGTFTAIDVATGKVVWQTRTAQRMLGTGSLATAGGLVFYGEQQGVLNAADARTGKLLWSVRTGGQVRAPPITYALDGRQYLSLAAGGALFTFALPAESARR